MIKKISKIMWITVLSLFVLGIIVGGITGNDTVAYLSGQLAALAIVVQIILLIIGFFTKSKES